eukprot:m.180097 g.180097  ORF g.180097 m.180097 type:complete len:273 (+) comp16851_c0_seq7:1458-2276(+)
MAIPERWQYDVVHSVVTELIAEQSRPDWFSQGLSDALTATAVDNEVLTSISTSIEPLFTNTPLPPLQAATWPIQPLSAVLAYNLASTILNHQLPLPPRAQAELIELQSEPLNSEGEPIQTQVTTAVEGLGRAAFLLRDPSLQVASLRSRLEPWWSSLTPAVFRMLCGLQPTAGAILELPPCLQTCIASFAAPHKPDSASKLSQGARALAKHCHRDETLSFWGVAKGPEQVWVVDNTCCCHWHGRSVLCLGSKRACHQRVEEATYRCLLGQHS